MAISDPVLEDGVSLVELSVAILIFAIFLALLVPTYMVLTNAGQGASSMSNADSQARLALETLTIQVNSAEAIYATPGAVSGLTSGWIYGQSLKMLTRAYGNLVCAEWRDDPSTSMLQERTWPPNWYQGYPTGTGWKTYATGMENTASSPVFSIGPARGFSAGLVHADLIIRAGRFGPPVELSTTLYAQGGLNLSNDSCKHVPS